MAQQLAGSRTRSPLHPITPRRSLLPEQLASSDCHAENSHAGCCSAAENSTVSMAQHLAGMAPPSAQSTPVKPWPEQLHRYKTRCAELAQRNQQITESCEHLRSENERLKAAHQATQAHAGESAGQSGSGAATATADIEAQAEQLAAQLQHILAEKGELQRDKEQLQQDNSNLLQMLDYAQAMLESQPRGTPERQPARMDAPQPPPGVPEQCPAAVPPDLEASQPDVSVPCAWPASRVAALEQVAMPEHEPSSSGSDWQASASSSDGS